jgi:hypothetical protein
MLVTDAPSRFWQNNHEQKPEAAMKQILIFLSLGFAVFAAPATVTYLEQQTGVR